ncbi:hypothetical protein GCM10009641_65880 [Mycobacterium cookii]|uniref:PknH-like extracellular domain-containing protein n=1 Tax=Nocardioides furvisabuli TaxID=375542 RepID=A0ABN2WN94_9ACTN|nr:hypothetical protein [Nocardioides furvisabuli]
MRRTLVVLVCLGALVAPSPVAAAGAVAGATADDPLTRTHLLTGEDHASVYPDLRDRSRSVLRSPLFAPRGCDDRALLVRGTGRIQGSVSPVGRRSSVSLIDQNLVRLESRREARALVRRYRLFSKECVGDVRTDDGEGGTVLLKNRAWSPPRVGDQSAGMLIGWFSRGGVDWRRVLAVRVGRTVSVLDVGFTGSRPPRAGVVALGERAADRLR